MRALFTTQPARGHFNALAPYARALAARGHEVAFATGPTFSPVIESEGLRCWQAGVDWRSAVPWQAAPIAHAVPAPAYHAWMMPLWAGETAGQLADDVVRLAHDWRPDVIVRETAELGGCLAAERLDVPHASVEADPNTARYALRHLAAPRLHALRRSLGLAPDPDMEAPYRHLHLAQMPPRFYRPGDAVAPTTRHVRPLPARRRAAPWWMDDLPDQPTVYASLGTVVRGPDTIAAILAGLRSEPVNLVMSAGREFDVRALGRLPPNVRVEAWLPQVAVLERCQAVITHGGFNTIKEALGLGLPLVVVPFQHDQLYNAERCAATGVGLVIPPAARTPERFRAAVRDVLRPGGCRQAARRMRDEMAALPVDGVRLIEKLAR